MTDFDESLFQRMRRPEAMRNATSEARQRESAPVARADEPSAAEDDASSIDAEVAEGDALTTALAERDRYFEQLQRTAADFANYRRRTESERAQQRLAANESLLRDIVPVLDDLQRGLGALPAEDQASNLAGGIRAVEQKFLATLRKHGVAPIEALGQPFDPSVHEAVEMDPTGGNDVVAIYAPGYRLGEGVLRPAMVKVGDGKTVRRQDGE